jgi:hypothetical protein
MTHPFTFEGRKRTLFKRMPDAFAPWYIRLHRNGKDEWLNLGTHVKAMAEQIARDMLRNERNGRIDESRDVLRQRKPANCVSIGQIVEACLKSVGGPSKATRADYIWALRKLIETVQGKTPAWTTHSVEILTPDFVYKYRTAILDQLEEEEADELDSQRTLRTGNSVLRQARAVFSPALLEYYRIQAELQLPDLNGFRSAPGFRGTVKKDYQRPADSLIEKTFAELEASRDTHPDRYKACWLALGFGLRKGEIAAAQTDWIVPVGGRIHLELRSVIQKDGTESLITKNGQAAPRIPVANGAWEKLQARPSLGAYFIGGCKSYRIDDIFREVNSWLRSLGWQTQKGIHELRAYAGCQVIMRDGLLAGSHWLRHERVETTQKFYGRYVQTQVSDVPLLAGSPASQFKVL